MTDNFPHGEYRGYSRHRREGTEPCEACVEAQKAYMKEFRDRNKSSSAKNRLGNKARSRALWMLAKEYPEDFQRILNEQYEKEGLS